MAEKVTYEEVLSSSKANEVDIAEIKALFKANAIESAKTDARIAETDKRFKEIQEELREAGIIPESLMEKTDEQMAEDVFASSLEEKMEFAGQKYTEIERNVHRKSKRAGLQDQYDVVLFNGKSVAIIEVKYAAQTKDLEKMVEKKVPNFRALLPVYENHKIYLGLGSFSFDDYAYKKAKELGIGLLRQQGDTIEADTDYVRAY